MSDPIIDNLTYTDFKNFFYREFKYIPQNEWNSTTTYVLNEKVYYRDTKKIYQCILAPSLNKVPDVETTYWQEKTDDVFQYVLPEDVERGFEDSKSLGRFDVIEFDDVSKKNAFLYLSAHMVFRRLLESKNPSFSGILSSLSVDSVSENYTIPQWLENDKNVYIKSSIFGIKYLDIHKRFTKLYGPFLIQGYANTL